MSHGGHGAPPPPPDPIPPHPHPGPDPKEKFIDKAWKLDSTWSLAAKAGGAFEGLFDKFEHSIRVVVQGGPDSDIRRVWYLACSAAFGRYRNRVKDSLGETAFQGVWDVSKKSCAVEVFYRTNRINQILAGQVGPNTITAALVSGATAAGGIAGGIVAGILSPAIKAQVKALFGGAAVRPTDNALAFMARGPEQLTVGAGWPSWLRNADPLIRPRVVWVGAPCKDAPDPDTAVQVQGNPPTSNRAALLGTTFGLQGVFREYPIVRGETTEYPARVGAGIRVDSGGLLPTNVAVLPADAGGGVTLPDDGRIITTAEKNDPLVQPPVPFADGNSRYNALIGLFAQTLHCPCFLPTTPTCTERPRANSSGVWLYEPGSPSGQTFAGLTNIVNSASVRAFTTPTFASEDVVVPNMTEADGVCFPQPPADEAKPVPAELKTDPDLPRDAFLGNKP